MDDVAKPPHLQKRGGIWYYYRRVPKELVPVIGKRFVKHSLKTGDLAQAKLRHSVYALNTDARFAAAARGDVVTGTGSAKGDLVSATALMDHVRTMVRTMDERAATNLREKPLVDLYDRREREMDAGYELDILTNPSDPRQAELVDHTATALLKKVGVELPDLKTHAQFEEVVRQGLIEVCRRRLDRYADRFDRPFHNPEFDPARRPTTTFGELAEIFLAEKLQEYRVNNVALKRQDKIKASVATLLEIVGPDLPISSIDDDIVQQVRSCVAQLPANRVKFYAKLPIKAAIERAAKEGRPALKSLTQSQYLDVFRDIMKVAVRKRFIVGNPAADIRPLKRDEVAASEKRKPWTMDQIRQFFGSEFYRSCAVDAAEPYSRPDRDWRFWLPLMMLFSGARPNEICQLSTDDIGRTDAGTWFVKISDDREGNTVKTQASRRRVPLHSELIAMGFLRFVKKREEADGPSRLFPMLKPNKYGNRAQYPLKRFSEKYIGLATQLDSDQSLYSLRHNVRDALRRVQAPPETLLAVSGWSPAGKAVSDNYGDPGNPDHHIRYVEGISYPGLDLSFLHIDR
ncbi:site-specific integrase [Stakelama pacifica]|uniref:site-specific integrase n=1 Tax=Stakelama pacifica TaxID=517720 RepID=UPI0013C2DBE1|nr:site-specific integrase [Stakelama pacifica]